MGIVVFALFFSRGAWEQMSCACSQEHGRFPPHESCCPICNFPEIHARVPASEEPLNSLVK